MDRTRNVTGRRQYLTRFALTMAPVGAMLLAVGATPRASQAAPPPPPNPVQPMNPVPTGLAQSWVAGFHLSGHFFHDGQRVSGTIDIKASQCLGSNGGPCYRGTNWGMATGTSACKPSALTCSWTVSGDTVPDWAILSMPINNTIGPAQSDDYYAVVGKNSHVIDGHVTDTAGNPVPGLPIVIAGVQNASVRTDAAGYYYAFVRKGSYDVSVGADTRYFKPQTKHVDLTDFATVDFEGAIHTDISISRSSVTDSGLETAMLTVHAYGPSGQPVANHPLHLSIAPDSGAAAVVCSAMPNLTGRIGPTDLAGGSPYYVPVNQPTDQTGALTYRVYFGSASGSIQFSVDDPSVTAAKGGADVSAFSSVNATITANDASSVPSSYSVKEYRAGVASTATHTVAGALASIIKGLTVNGAVPQPVNLNGSAADVQKSLLRAIEGSDLFNGLGLSPITGPNGAGVLIYVRGHLGNNARTVVLDTSTAQSLQSAFLSLTHADSDVHLPTRNDWEKNVAGGSSVLDYAGGEPEQGITYAGGLPYLPVSDGDLTAFDNTCAGRAAGS